MKINHIYNKSVTCLEPGEVVAEKYNGSNARFAILKTKKLTDSSTIQFTNLKQFDWIAWGDGTVTYPNGGPARHVYQKKDRSYIIIVNGIQYLTEYRVSGNSKVIAIGADLIESIYFGDDVTAQNSTAANASFTNCSNLKSIKNISQTENGLCSGLTLLEEVSFNIDCNSISSYAFDNMYTHESYKEAYKCIFIPKSIKKIEAHAFKDAHVFVCIEHTEIPKGYSTTGNFLIRYSEELPTQQINQYWHYNEEGLPVLWCWKTFSCKIDENTIKKYTFEEEMSWEEWRTNVINGVYNVDGWVIKENKIYQNSESNVPLKDSSGNDVIATGTNGPQQDVFYYF